MRAVGLLLALSMAITAGLLAWNRRLWFPTRAGRPWWRASVLTSAEDLRVGATAAAIAATLAASAATITAQVWYHHTGTLRSTAGVIVGHDADGSVLEVFAHSRTARARRIDLDSVNKRVGTALEVELDPHGAVRDDEPPRLNMWSGSCLLLLGISVIAVLRSTSRRARRQLVVYRM